MNEWFYVMILGLAMDIIGVWMLVGPLLNVNLRHKSNLEKNTQDAIKEYERVKDQKAGNLNSEHAMWSGVARLEAIIYQLHLSLLKEKITHRETAIRALIIITVGFMLQIIANMIQAFY